jgi:hypothetical protein
MVVDLSRVSDASKKEKKVNGEKALGSNISVVKFGVLVYIFTFVHFRPLPALLIFFSSPSSILGATIPQ